MPLPTSNDVFVSAPLSNMMTAYIQKPPDFVALNVAPIIPVEKQAGSYFTFPKASWFLDPGDAARRGDVSESNGGGYTVSTSTYSCDVWAWHKDVGRLTKENTQTPLDVVAHERVHPRVKHAHPLGPGRLLPCPMQDV